MILWDPVGRSLQKKKFTILNFFFFPLLHRRCLSNVDACARAACNVPCFNNCCSPAVFATIRNFMSLAWLENSLPVHTHTHVAQCLGLESVRTILYMVRVDCIHWIDIYERCQVWVVQKRRGAFAFEWGPVSLSFYVRLVLVKPTGRVRLMQSTAFFASSSASTTSCVIPMSKGSHDSVHSIFLICSFLFRPCNFAATLYCCLPCR